MDHVIIHNMVGGDVNPYPILVLVNYWEIRANRIGHRLDELLKIGVNQFGAFVPWQAVESDVTHTLTRFLQAVSVRRMNVHLILSPELGIHYPNSGIPKDIISRQDNSSYHYQYHSGESGKIIINLPPNSFPLPSIFAPEFSKRYYSFLARLDSYFTDLSKNHPDLLNSVKVLLTGSFWKYYRSPVTSSLSPFGGTGGDYSSHASVAYRQRVDQFYTQKEFMDPNPSSANRWKTRALEETNRRWFYQQSEDIFRNRSFQTIRKRCVGLQISEIELYTPEADPASTYSNFLQMISGGRSDFSRLSRLISEAASRISFSGCCQNGFGYHSAANVASASPFSHWTAMGGFRLLSDSEKQFLILKSLLLFGAQGGGFSIDESEWFSFSPQFRTRADSLARSLSQKELNFRVRALYLVPHLWSDYGVLWNKMSSSMGPEAKLISSLDLVLREKSAQLLVIDPSFILTREVIHKVSAWARSGRLVALPASQLLTQQGKNELDQLISSTKRLEIDLGLPYRVYSIGDGKMVIYELPEPYLDPSNFKSQHPDASNPWQRFLTTVLSIADAEAFYRLSDSRLSSICFEKKGEGHALFVMNGTRSSVSADIIFPMDVRVADLGVALNHGASLNPGPGGTSAHRFSLDVPPMGILSMSVSGLDFVEIRERQLAAQISKETLENVYSVVETELPGFDSEEIWS